MLNSQSLVELTKFVKEIETNLRLDSSLWSNQEYYTKLLAKAKWTINTTIVKAIYLKFLKETDTSSVQKQCI